MASMSVPWILRLMVTAICMRLIVACTPCDQLDEGSLDLNSNALPTIGGAFCFGSTQSAQDIAGSFDVELSINAGSSRPDYSRGLSYQLALYDDAMYAALNGTQTCDQQLAKTQPNKIRDVEFDSSLRFSERIDIDEPVSRNWYLLLTHCEPLDDAVGDLDLLYPVIGYRINMTLSLYVKQREKVCTEDTMTQNLSAGTMVAIVILSVVLIVVGGLIIWRCDVYRREKARQAAFNQSLVEDEQHDEEHDDIDDEDYEVNNQDEQLVTVTEDDIVVSKEDIELETA